MNDSVDLLVRFDLVILLFTDISLRFYRSVMGTSAIMGSLCFPISHMRSSYI